MELISDRDTFKIRVHREIDDIASGFGVLLYGVQEESRFSRATTLQHGGIRRKEMYAFGLHFGVARWHVRRTRHKLLDLKSSPEYVRSTYSPSKAAAIAF